MLDMRELGDHVDRVRKQALGVELLLTTMTGQELECARGKIHDERAIGSNTLQVQVWLDGGRCASVSGAPTAIDSLVTRALAAAQSAPDNAFSGPLARLNTLPHGLGIADRRYDQVDREDRHDVALAAEKSVRATDRRLSASGFKYRAQRTVRRFANSKGLRLEETSTRYAAEGTVTASIGGDMVRLHDQVAARSFASIASFPYGTNLARRAVALLQKGETLDGEIRTMLPPRVVARLFAALGTAFIDSAFDDDKTFFMQQRPDGEPILDTRIHMVDDGTVPRALHTRSFDDRGVSPVPLTLLREGRVAGRFIGPERARRLDVRPTGHFRDGTLVPTNLMLRSGTRSMNATFTDHDCWSLWVDDIDASDLDLKTGKLRTTLSGQVMKSNEPRGAMRNVAVEADLLDLLNRVLEVCSDTDRHGHVDAPGMFVEGFRLT